MFAGLQIAVHDPLPPCAPLERVGDLPRDGPALHPPAAGLGAMRSASVGPSTSSRISAWTASDSSKAVDRANVRMVQRRQHLPLSSRLEPRQRDSGSAANGRRAKILIATVAIQLRIAVPDTPLPSPARRPAGLTIRYGPNVHAGMHGGIIAEATAAGPRHQSDASTNAGRILLSARSDSTSWRRVRIVTGRRRAEIAARSARRPADQPLRRFCRQPDSSGSSIVRESEGQTPRVAEATDARLETLPMDMQRTSAEEAETAKLERQWFPKTAQPFGHRRTSGPCRLIGQARMTTVPILRMPPSSA